MNDAVENLAVQKQIAEDIRQMFQTSAGWKATQDIIEEMRREAFSEWGELKLGAPVEDIISIRAKEKVLKELLERLSDTVKKGDEAAVSITRAETDNREEIKFRAEKVTTDAEIERLRKPLSPSWIDRFLPRTPQGAGQ